MYIGIIGSTVDVVICFRIDVDFVLDLFSAEDNIKNIK
ncbi:MAG: hypothetical protein JG777_2209 [Clostridia bacterium]|jgi:hypothetical protein|nr:hypothetical protein [Clostridia bacterium]